MGLIPTLFHAVPPPKGVLPAMMRRREALISRGTREPLHFLVGHFIVSITVPMANEMRITPIFHEIHFHSCFPRSTARRFVYTLVGLGSPVQWTSTERRVWWRVRGLHTFSGIRSISVSPFVPRLEVSYMKAFWFVSDIFRAVFSLRVGDPAAFHGNPNNREVVPHGHCAIRTLSTWISGTVLPYPDRVYVDCPIL